MKLYCNPQRYAVDPDGIDDVKAAGQALVAKYFDHLEMHLEGRECMVGDRRSREPEGSKQPQGCYGSILSGAQPAQNV